MTGTERAGLVKETLAGIAALKAPNVPAWREVRRRLSAKLKKAGAANVKAVALGLFKAGHWWFAYEIINQHKPALQSLTIRELEALGRGMASWEEVDTFGVLLSGAAWLNGQISDADIKRWARSKDFWQRRAALVSTVVLNHKTRGGKGDAKRTLMICAMLAGDHEDMVVKAMSWALRSLVQWDAKAVTAFLAEHEDELAARVKREVRNKLRTGLKTPKQDRAKPRK